ncbi:MAG: hypothetical protein RLY31_2319 [Bacteroidota bacterium]|jgi:redox-sensitive bicupin YhaK (pirin superfamily)
MAIQIIPKDRQAKGAFNGGEIIENKPIGFPREGGALRPYSNLFYWAYAEALVDSTIGLHPHEGFEIMSFVLKGNIRHYDTQLKEWRPLGAGDMQIIRAGNGISHAEFIAGGGAIFQIWVDPDLARTLRQPASYDDYTADRLPRHRQDGMTTTTFVGPASPVTLDTPGLDILRLDFDSPGRYQPAPDTDRTYSCYIMDGDFLVNGEPAGQDDFILVEEESHWHLDCRTTGSAFLVASPRQPGYRTYARMMQHRG